VVAHLRAATGGRPYLWRQAIGAWRVNQYARLHQGPHALLQEEGISLGALDQEPFQWCQAGVISQEALE
jgi:hypothetical protein